MNGENRFIWLVIGLGVGFILWGQHTMIHGTPRTPPANVTNPIAGGAITNLNANAGGLPPSCGCGS